MRIQACVSSSEGSHAATVASGGSARELAIPPRSSGLGSSVNGGELLFLALATCYCNDIYREAGKRGITVEQVEVEVEGDFGAEGEPATGVTYRARVVAQATGDEIRELMQHTDTVAEIQNTLRASTPVTLAGIEAIGAAPRAPGAA